MTSGPLAPRAAVDDLVAFALASLPTLRHPSGLYCFDREFASPALRGESVRYSFMVLLGLQRAAAAGYAVGVDLDELFDCCLDRRDDFTPGDVGLALWADARRDGAARGELIAQLQRALNAEPDLDALVGMEIAWIVIGLAEQLGAGGDDAGLLARVLRGLLRRRMASGLFRHDATGNARSRFPNFATEIYAVLALATVLARGLDSGVRGPVEQTAGRLLQLQLPDGGWPWLFDARRGSIVEEYEVYSVHQDAMAPMAFLELSAVTGDPRYRDAAVAGLAWSRGHNELGFDLLDAGARFAHRSIRRRNPWSRAALAANTAGSTLVGRPLRRRSSALEVNRTCRPYHLGWMLEAWAGREPDPAAKSGD